MPHPYTIEYRQFPLLCCNAHSKQFYQSNPLFFCAIKTFVHQIIL
jgi:hypothetical protein